MNTHTATPQEVKTTRKNRFIDQVRIMRKMQDILEKMNTEIADIVHDKIEDVMQGEYGVKFTPKEKGLQERIFLQAKFELAKERAEMNLANYDSCSFMHQHHLRGLKEGHKVSDAE